MKCIPSALDAFEASADCYQRKFSLKGLGFIAAFMASLIGTAYTQENYGQWQAYKNLTINTRTSGLGGNTLSGNVHKIPILIRLTTANNSDVFNRVANSSGTDIRFSNASGTEHLPYQRERFNKTLGLAEFWVLPDSVIAADSAVSIRMYFGMSGAGDSSNSFGVFDTGNGFQATYHMEEGTSAQAMDATVNQYTLTPFGSTGTGVTSAVPTDTAGIIGRAFHFQADIAGGHCNQFEDTTGVGAQTIGAPKLVFPADGQFTVSAWVKADTVPVFLTTNAAYNYDAFIINKGPYKDGTAGSAAYNGGDYYLKSAGQAVPPWQAGQFNGTAGTVESWTGTVAAVAHQWQHLVFVSNGTGTPGQSVGNLYVNGVLVSTTYPTPAAGIRVDSLPLVIGSDGPQHYYRGFNGYIDEVELANVARSADWIQLSYQNQQASQNVLLLPADVTPGVPTLAAPTNGATGQPVSSLSLSWSSTAGGPVSAYAIQVSTTTSFASTVYSNTVTTMSQVLPALAGGTLYCWQVTAIGAGGSSGSAAQSKIYSFTTASAQTTSQLPSLSSPSNGSINLSLAPTLIWGAVTGSASYEVKISTGGSFGTTVLDLPGITTTSTIVPASALSNNSLYYWEVNGDSANGNTTGWSSVWSFSTVIATPVLSSPTSGATNQSLSLSLNWGAVSGSKTYAISVSTSSTFGTSVFSQVGLTGVYQVVSGLVVGTTYYWQVNASNSLGSSAWSSVWSFTVGARQALALGSAWNMVSLNVLPSNDSATAVFGNGSGGFLFVKDNAGNQYCPILSQNGIGLVQVGQGYQVYSSVADTLAVTGTPVNYAATPIALSAGWNMFAYLPSTDDTVEHALGSIDTAIVLMKNNVGQAYWPGMQVDEITVMHVGQAYKVLMSSPLSFTYPVPDSGVAKRAGTTAFKPVLRLGAPRHYAVHAVTGNNATVLASRVTIGGGAAPDSSEIAAFDGSGSLVGSGTVVHGIAAFSVWGKDPQTKRKDGCEASEPVTFRLWDGKREYPLDYVTKNGTTAQYGVDKVLLGFLSVPEGYLITKFDLSRAYPNPFRGSVSIAFDVPTIAGVAKHAIEINVYDMKGSLVKQLASGVYPAGHYTLGWNGNADREGAVGSSVYIVRMKAANFDKRLKLVRLQ